MAATAPWNTKKNLRNCIVFYLIFTMHINVWVMELLYIPMILMIYKYAYHEMQ